MSISVKAARLNNEGIEYIQSENYPRSIELLGESIKVLKQILLKPTATNPEEIQPSSSSAFLAVELPLQKEMNQQDDFIFNQAFQVLERKEDATFGSDIQTITAVVIFNLALAYHCQYVREQKNVDNQEQQQKCLLRIEKLYIMSLKLLANRSCPNTHTALIVKLACVNNLSIIGSHNCYRAAAEALESLSSFVSSGGDLDIYKTDGIFEEKKHHRLLMNVLFLKTPRVAPAA